MHSNENYSFQEVIPGLFIGSQHALSSLYPLIVNKITHLLAVNNCKEKPVGFTMKVMNIEDHEYSDIISCFQECINFINSSKRILVFCSAGRSRSAAVVAAYLIKEKQMSLTEALYTINRVRPVMPNDGFILQLQAWEKESGCRVCRILDKANKVFEEEDICVIHCPGCQFPMAVMKEHTARKTSDIRVVAEDYLREIANKYCDPEKFRIKLGKPAHIFWHTGLEETRCENLDN